MTVFIKYFLLVYFLLFFSVIFVGIGIKISRSIGKSPVVLPSDDSAYALIGRYFKWTLLGVGAYIAGYFFYPAHILLAPFADWPYIRVTGVLCMLTSFAWILVAQVQMKEAWRIGIDRDTRTELVTSGLFKISRNPVFLGMIVNLGGLTQVTPNIVTLMLLVIGTCCIQLQVRMEEDFLLQEHGNNYRQYKQNTPRFI